jgi:hypothetical protein
MDQSEAVYPDCVQAPEGYPGQPAQGNWIPPECGGAPEELPPEEPPPEEPPPEEPPPVEPPKDPEGYYPVDTPPEGCPEGQVLNNEDKCVPGHFSACRNGDGSWRLFKLDGDLDYFNDVYYGNVPNAYANGVNYPEGVVASIAAQQYCDNNPIPTEGPEQVAPAPEAPAAPAPTPTPTPTPTLAPAPAPMPAPTRVSPGAAVRVVPGPFRPAPAPTQVPIAPAPQRRSCPASSTPYKTHMFPGATQATRPDDFVDGQQWTS